MPGRGSVCTSTGLDGIGDVVDLEAVVVALNRVLAGEREIRVRRAERPCPVGGVVESMRMFHAACAGVPAAGLEPDARIGRRRGRRHNRRRPAAASPPAAAAAEAAACRGRRVQRPPQRRPRRRVALARRGRGARRRARRRGAARLPAPESVPARRRRRRTRRRRRRRRLVHELAHAGTPNASTRATSGVANRPWTSTAWIPFHQMSTPPAFPACDRSRSTDRRRRRTRT